MPNNHTIHDADDAIRRRFASEGANIQLDYNTAKVIETENWWYIPCGWIGCSGLIVDKNDLYVNWLGSAFSLDDCIWGHDHGIVCDSVDFTFTDKIAADELTIRRLVARFKHYVSRRSIPTEEFIDWYSEREIDGAIRSQYPTFRRHFVWFAIPDLRKAVDAGTVSFSVQRSDRKA